VGRVEDLVAVLGERAQHAEEMPLRVRTEVQLRLLDQQDESAQVRRQQPLHPHHELEPAVGRGPVVLRDRRLEEVRDVRTCACHRREQRA
jgi:hypothetical protein